MKRLRDAVLKARGDTASSRSLVAVAERISPIKLYSEIAKWGMENCNTQNQQLVATARKNSGKTLSSRQKAKVLRDTFNLWGTRGGGSVEVAPASVWLPVGLVPESANPNPNTLL